MLGKLNDKRGQSAVELALLLPILLLLFMGIFEFGRVMNAYLVVNNAAREGARASALGETDLQVVQSVENALAGMDLSRTAISVIPEEGVRTRGETVRVTVSYDIDLVTPLMTLALSDPHHIEITTSMRIE